MRLINGLIFAVSLATFPVASALVGAQAPAQLSWASVEDALGRKGTIQPGNIIKFSFPRSDLAVTARGVPLKPAFALGSWVAFKPVTSGQVMVMGDLVLMEDEVSAVMQTLQAGGVEQTALHNHVLGESPRIMYMHIAAHGDAARIATTIHSALATSKTPLTAPALTAPSSATEFDTTGVAAALGYAGKLNGVVYQVSVPRAERITEMGVEVLPSMGVATAINFQPTGNGKAAITGDFVMIGSEVNNVIRALRANGIEVTALHSHMLNEKPRLFFMHFWANDDATKLARGLKAALDKTNSKK